MKFLLSFFAAVILCACGTFETGAYRTIGTISIAVDKGMDGWGDYVRAGKATPADQARVRSLYEKYEGAMRTARAAVVSFKSAPATQSTVQAALDAASASSDSLLALVYQFVPKAAP